MASAEKSVLITGCSAGGIGSALAEEFHSKGWTVFATARNLDKVQHLQQIGCEIIMLDVTKVETIKASVENVKRKTGGRLDMLVNNAGITYTTTVLDADMDLMRKVFDINFFGVISTTQHFAPLLLRAKGTIVNIGSMTGNIQGPYCSAYGGSKAAIEMVSHAMRIEMEPLGLHVVHVTAGIVASHCWDNMPPKAIKETSLYFPIKEKAEALMTPEGTYMSPSTFATDVFSKITKTNPPALFWSGSMTWPPRIVGFFVFFFGPRIWDLAVGGVSGLNDLAKIMRSKETKNPDK